MSSSAKLIPVGRGRNASAAVIVLHGGAARRESMMVSPYQLSVLRMIPIARRLARVDGLAVFRLLNTARGWDAHTTPADDARQAVDQVIDRVGDVPVGLVGHSLGGRAAILAGDAGPVRSVVALAPWVYPDDGPDLSGRRVLIVHGSQDRIARPASSATVARTLARTAEVGYVTIEGGKHAMLSHHRQYDGYATDFTAATLLPDRDHRVAGPVQQILDGQQWVTA